jgi:endonuclease YncB( thermonuclease family)
MRWAAAVVLVASFSVAPAVNAQTAVLGRVVGVTAGNSLLVQLEDGSRVQVILAYLAIPRDDQPHAARAAEVLRAQLSGQAINLRPVGRPGDGFIRALVYVRGNNFNQDFVRRGHAWINPFEQPPNGWYGVQAAAQAAGAGLWADPGPVHPAEWQIAKRDAEHFNDTMGRSQDTVKPEQWKRVLVGDKRTKRYVPFTCRAWTRIPERDVMPFVSVKAAEAAGFRPTACSP